MIKQINHLFEPERLKLIWQNPDLGGDRTNYHVADLVREEAGIRLSYRVDTPDYTKAVETGFSGYANFACSAHSSDFPDVSESLYRRLPPRSRGDFSTYLNGFGLPADSPVSPFALLGYSGATLPGDTFYCLFYYEDMPLPTEFVMHVVGFRHVQKDNIVSYKNVLSERQELTPRCEPENVVDSHAIALYHDDGKVGYVNRNSTGAFQSWIDSKRKLEICSFRINGTASQPRLLAFVEVTD